MRSVRIPELLGLNELTAVEQEHEKEVRQNRFLLRSWLQYLEYHNDEINQISERISEMDTLSNESQNELTLISMKITLKKKQCARHILFERALCVLPGSYKLWFRYLNDRIEISQKNGLKLTDPFIIETNLCFDRCLSILPKMPRLWMMYVEFLGWQRHITLTRRTFDRALKALPITQHHLIWPLYLRFIKVANVTETAVRVFRRYIQVRPDQVEVFIEYLLKRGRLNEACLHLCQIVNDDSFESIKKRSKFQLWSLLCQICVKNPRQVTSIDVDAIIRSGIRKYPSEIGKLWVNLAEYYVRSGEFERARDVYEESIASVSTLRDFTICFDNYARFEESIIEMKSSEMVNDDQDDGDGAGHESPITSDMNDDLKLRVERYADLIEKRHPLLMNAVLLRQNPHNIAEWMNRVYIYIEKHDPPNVEMALETFQQALATVDCHKCGGSISDLYENQGKKKKMSSKMNNDDDNDEIPPLNMADLWVKYASFFEEYDQDLENGLSNARAIFATATDRKNRNKFRNNEELSQVWCQWIEMELRHKKYAKAKETANESVISCPRSKTLWNLLADIEESLFEWWNDKDEGKTMMDDDDEEAAALHPPLPPKVGIEEVKSVYSRMIELKIATVSNILNICSLLEKCEYFEESFKFYERGISVFSQSKSTDSSSSNNTKRKGMNLTMQKNEQFDEIKSRTMHSLFLWQTYLSKFIERFEGRKLERLRDLFQECLQRGSLDDSILNDYLKESKNRKKNKNNNQNDFQNRSNVVEKEWFHLWLLYAKIEEKYGYPRRAMKIYNQACLHFAQLSNDENGCHELCFEMFRIYIMRAADLFGVSRTREIYNLAMETIHHRYIPWLCLSYILLELKMTEIDRARAIFNHGCQFASPIIEFEEYWKKWYDFEVEYGNDDTFEEMLRLKSSVEALNTTVSLNIDNDNDKVIKQPTIDLSAEDISDAMSILESEVRMENEKQSAILKDPSEIDLFSDDSNNAKSKPLVAADEIELELKEIPMTVFTGQM